MSPGLPHDFGSCVALNRYLITARETQTVQIRVCAFGHEILPFYRSSKNMRRKIKETSRNRLRSK